LVLLVFVKKLTVMGIKGNTQGVNKAANPERNAMIKMPQRLLFSVSVEMAELARVVGGSFSGTRLKSALSKVSGTVVLAPAGSVPDGFSTATAGFAATFSILGTAKSNEALSLMHT